MLRALELLAPARNADIGIAAIDCGADAVYIAGPGFGARHSAGNPVDEVRRLCEYAHRFGARIFVTLNTILYDGELPEARAMMRDLEDAGADAFIVQDLAVRSFGARVPLHASTQCSIRTPEDAAFYSGMGFSRLVLERQLSLEDIRKIHSATPAELEFFVHGALCVCYSGQCYMSEAVAGRSANRGECVQACRSLYDLVDSSGRTLVRNKALLSLKDLNLSNRLADLADAGISSFKIEGRLKNISYVRNVTREYSMALDALVASRPDLYRRASFGRIKGGFTPMPDKTFNRGYTELFIDGKRGSWASMDAPKSMGTAVGQVVSVRPSRNGETVITLDRDPSLRNGDGFSFISASGIQGFRGDVCIGREIRCKAVEGLEKGMTLYRNIDSAFEKELSGNLPQRLIGVKVAMDFGDSLSISAESEDGRKVSLQLDIPEEKAENQERMESMIYGQMEKTAGHYSFSLEKLSAADGLPLMKASEINGIRRTLASRLDALPCNIVPMPSMTGKPTSPDEEISYKSNVSNHISRQAYLSGGSRSVEKAFELTHRKDTELMRTKYCIKHELGLCPVHQGASPTGPLFLVNNGRRFPLRFDCSRCEMAVID